MSCQPVLSPLDLYRERKAAIDEATGQPDGTVYMQGVIDAAEGLIGDATVLLIPAGGRDEVYRLAIAEMRYRLEKSTRG